MGDMKKIFIVDDHPMFREGLKSIIAQNPQFEMAGEAGDGQTALQVLENLKPDVILMDISLPDSNGIELIREIRTILPAAQILIVSMHGRIDYITAAFQAGAMGYIVKDASSGKILQALDLVSRGEYFLDTSIAREVVERLADSPRQEAQISDSAYSSLSRREQEILRLLAEGRSSREVAEVLFISRKTVENHRTNIMAKLGLHSTMELLRYAARLGLIDIDRWKS
jgi:DNA-binding NarL/FixJ family response regulator